MSWQVRIGSFPWQPHGKGESCAGAYIYGGVMWLRHRGQTNGHERPVWGQQAGRSCV